MHVRSIPTVTAPHDHHLRKGILTADEPSLPSLRNKKEQVGGKQMASNPVLVVGGSTADKPGQHVVGTASNDTQTDAYVQYGYNYSFTVGTRFSRGECAELIEID
jgi:hypothetical protein